MPSKQAAINCYILLEFEIPSPTTDDFLPSPGYLLQDTSETGVVGTLHHDAFLTSVSTYIVSRDEVTEGTRPIPVTTQHRHLRVCGEGSVATLEGRSVAAACGERHNRVTSCLLHLHDILAERVLFAPVLHTFLALDVTLTFVQEEHSNQSSDHA